MNFSIKSLLSCGASLACLAFAAQAQSVDYNTLQQTFGEPVTTSATGKPQRASDVPADMIIITQDQIRRSGAVKLMDMLKFVPGLDVRTYGDINANINVNGYLQPAVGRLLVLINGRQVYLDHFGYVDWNTIPVQMSEILQIEIVKGPGSSLFGFNAVSGVINIITINPQQTHKVQVQATAGSYGLRDVSGVVAGKITDTVAAKISGGYSTQDAYSVAQFVSLGSPWNPSSENAAAELSWQAADNVVVRGETTWARSHQMEMAALAGFTNMIMEMDSYKGGVTADTYLGLVDFSAYHNHLKHFAYGPPGPPYGPTGLAWMYDDVSVLSASDLFKASNDVTVRVGTEYRFNKVQRLGVPFGAQIMSLDGMVDWAITPVLSWTNSARIDLVQPQKVAAYDYHVMTPYSFNSGVVYKAGPEDTVRVLAGRSIQLPQMLALMRVPGIKPSSLMKYQVAWDHALTDINSTVHTSVYYQKITRLMTYGLLNLGDSASTGVEVSLEGSNKDGWRWGASVNWRSVNDDLNYTASGKMGYAMDFEQTMPKYLVTFNLGKTIGDFEADLQGKWVSKSKDLAPVWLAATLVPVKAYLSMTARVGYKISDNFTLGVTAEQLNQKTVFEGANDPDKRRFMVTLTSSL